MFWGLTLQDGKFYSQTVDRPFHVSMAALESQPDEAVRHVQLMLRQKSDFLLCTLGPGAHLQQQLDLTFSHGEEVEFFLVGNGVVHLSGSVMEEESDFADDYDEDEHDTDSDAPELVSGGDSDNAEDDNWVPTEESGLCPGLDIIASPAAMAMWLASQTDGWQDAGSNPSGVGSKRKAAGGIQQKGKKMKIVELDEDDEEEEEKDDSDDEYDSSFIDDKSLEEEEEEDSDEEEESLLDASASKSPSQKTSLVKKNKTPDVSSETPTSSKKHKKHKKGDQTPEQTIEVSAAGDAQNGDAATKKKKKKKKKKNKNKEDTGDDQNQQWILQQQSSPEKVPESASPKPSPAVGKKRTVAGGTSVEDVKIGHGPEAKPGTMVSVYYAGTLAKNNKRFDSCLKGKPLRFRLGRGEVIKGWDTGLIGMKVGGKRKITVPPSQGYGNTRQGPIPPGSTLIFDVEMKAVS
ncbi:46 kDa FK506-binding nuclear protein-like isoform X4 [Babylonia areolata]|uniref:46 kDa FK506-binding nuclear protein-like isoform X4 n=1 Tax=Babylonia areolata TaxID=304850 RepID=UPI003FD16F65